MAKAWTKWGTHTAYRSLLEFDLSAIPQGCTVTNAVLVLHSEGTIIPGSWHCGTNSTVHPCISNEMEVHRVTQPWAEMNVTWANQPTFASSTQGIDYISVPNNDLPYNDYNLDITDMVSYWQANPSQNFGLIMKQVDETTHYKTVHVASSDHFEPTLRPELILTLSCSGSCNNKIEGYVFEDQNSDCVMNGSDQPLENWVVEILPGPTYATTNANGYYSAWVMDGSYTVNQTPPNTVLWNPTCPSPVYSHNVSLTGGAIVSADFGVVANQYCPILEVDVASNFLRKCHTENFVVNYCNNGNQLADSVYIDVHFSPGLTPLSSDLAYTIKAPNVWSFFLDTLNSGDCGFFYINTHIDCNANFGDIECVQAEMFPDYICHYPQDTTGTWDRSSVMVQGDCVGDSLACFMITNTGDANGNMQAPSTFRIYDNNVLVYAGTFQLLGGADTTICWSVNSGHTIRLEADQRPGHPGNSHPNDVVENCGTNASSNNFGTNLPEDDEPADIAEECAEVRSSYDPNDKRVIPSGVGTQHYIDQNLMLDYKIRFQNTGNDTALYVIIRDTLSQYLDINTIQIGSSSHDYTFSIEGNRVLKFTFSSIMLPDSNVNEPASHGFVKFKVKQNADLPIGTIIDNSAAIYFDYNAPVLTNNTFLTIGDMDYILGTYIDKVYTPQAFVNVYPNPFRNTATVTINGYQGTDNIRFELYNAFGARVQIKQSNSHQFEIGRKDLSAGVYFYKVSANKEFLGSGKLIVR